MNRVMLVGNLGRDPEVKVLADGVMVARIGLATSEVFRDKDGRMRANTQWHTVIFWRALAQLVEKYLRKGSMIYVEGKIQYRKYEDKLGVMKYVTEIVASQLLMLDKREIATEAKQGEGAWEEPLPF